jgi:murein DD-endopeptidase MepM/ murein hydrolase activator NlpD
MPMRTLIAAAAAFAVLASNAASGPLVESTGRIAFVSTRAGGADIYSTTPDGASATVLAATLGSDTSPSWSPDGTRVAFASDIGGDMDLYTAGTNGTGVVRLTTESGYDGEPGWSPDGGRIAFASDRSGSFDIYTLDLATGAVTDLTNTPGVDERQPAWAPDGSRVAFTRGPPGDRDIWSCASNGGGETPLVAGAGDDVAPAWSSDGTRLAFAGTRAGASDVYALDLGSGQLAQITNDQAAEGDPAWAPDGSAIAFDTDRDGNWEIYVASVDGSSPRNVTSSPASDTDPSWGPSPGGGSARPDLAIRTGASGAFVGGGVHGAGQTVKVRVVPGTTVRFTIRLRNGGSATGSFQLHAGSGEPGVSAAYSAAGLDITNAITAGTYEVDELPAGGARLLRLELSVAPTALGGRTVTVATTAVSLVDPSLSDEVRARVQVLGSGRYSYGWPVKPFFVQHAVRGYFGDPRVGPSEGVGPIVRTFHFGVDVSAPDFTPVYATVPGIVGLNPLHGDVVEVQQLNGVVLEYWHVIRAVRGGDIAAAYKTIVGRVEGGWQHVHVSERIGGVYLNPLRRGAMGPYADPTVPAIGQIEAAASGRVLAGPLHAAVDLVAGAVDRPALVPPAPWERALVTPALVQWRVVNSGGTPLGPWRTAFDVRRTLPVQSFSAVFAPGTRQNRPNRPGWYRFYLARSWPVGALASGRYSIQVRASDSRGNTIVRTRPITVG